MHQSGEMYLETILILSKSIGRVRSLDVANYMNFSKPSVSRGVGILKKGGYLTSDEDGFLSLTETGREIAEKIYERHNVISETLQKLGVDPETASEDACKIEHVISDRSFAALKEHFVRGEEE